MQLTFLGTSCMVPTKQRNVSSVFLSFKNEGILFDCGEGTQRQMNITGIKRTKVTKILVSHWHADHVSGITGLLQTIANDEAPPKIHIFGPKGTKKNMEHMMAMATSESKVNLTIHEADPKGVEKIYEDKDYLIEAANLEHTTPCIGFSFIEKDRRRINMAYLNKFGVKEGPHLQDLQEGKSIEWKGKEIDVEKATTMVYGKKITYVMDTVLCSNAIELAKDADLLICESAYSSNLEKKAKQYKHLTAKQAGMIANNADAKKLILTHFSQRYKNTQEIEEDARDVFDNVLCAKDFMKVKV